MVEFERFKTDDNINDDFGCVLNCAIRYCLGRRTYMPGLVTNFIKNSCGDLMNKKTVEVMIRDIEECECYGDRCDEETWANFLEWLRDKRDNE